MKLGYPKFSLKTQSIDYADFHSYSVCGEYFRALQKDEIALPYTTHSYEHTLFTRLLYYYLNTWWTSRSYMSNEQILTLLSKACYIIAEGGGPTYSHGQISDMYMKFLKLIDCIKPKISDFSVGTDQLITIEGLTIRVPIPVLYKSIPFIYVDRNDPLKELLPRLLSVPGHSHYILTTTQDGSYIFEWTSYTKQSLFHNKTFISSLARGIVNNVFVPRFNCTDNSCPHYPVCNYTQKKTRRL